MNRLTVALSAICCLAFAGNAFAHAADILYVQLEQAPKQDEVSERMTLAPSTLLMLAALDSNHDGRLTEAELEAGRELVQQGIWERAKLSAASKPCPLLSTSAQLEETFVALTARFRCPQGSLAQDFSLLASLPNNYRVVLGSNINGQRAQHFVNVQSPVVRPTELGSSNEAGSSSLRGFRGWVALGIQHIFGGVDHLAFLLGLLVLAKSWRRVFLLVTSFTLAHSITLGASALGLWVISPGNQKWVELLIAVSIVFVAVENLLLRSEPKHRQLVTFVFGLIHGFGFASVLRDYGIEKEVVPALFGFNMGVELGQACVVFVAMPIFRMVQRRSTLGKVFPLIASVAIALAGGYWMWDRW